MKWFLLMVVSVGLWAHDGVGFHFRVEREDYWNTTYFDMDSEDLPVGMVEKPTFRPRGLYHLYDCDGVYEGYTTRRLWWPNLGYVWNEYAEFDCYDERGQWIGAIDGMVVTTAAAKYQILDSNNERVALAFVERGGTKLRLTAPDNDKHEYAQFERNFVQDRADFWIVRVYDAEVIDLRIIKSLAAFMCDAQDSFVEDR